MAVGHALAAQSPQSQRPPMTDDEVKVLVLEALELHKQIVKLISDTQD